MYFQVVPLGPPTVVHIKMNGGTVIKITHNASGSNTERIDFTNGNGLMAFLGAMSYLWRVLQLLLMLQQQHIRVRLPFICMYKCMYVCYMLYKADSARACVPAHTQVEAKREQQKNKFRFLSWQFLVLENVTVYICDPWTAQSYYFIFSLLLHLQ